MREYISKERARAAIRTMWSESEGDAGLLDYQAAIENEPPADVKPVVRGRWTEIDRDVMGEKTYLCDKCGGTMKDYAEPKFCKNCGADMREEEE